MSPVRLKGIELFAWIGEDEFGSGAIGIKQGLVPAGYIPLVATAEEKMNRNILRVAMSLQAANYGKKIYLCRFIFSEVCWSTQEGASV
jgi:hypothetical protein